MRFRPKLTLATDDGEVTHRQLQALRAVAEAGSMKRAAALLGVSAPVLYKYVKEVEERCGTDLVSSGSRGTVLTEQGKMLVSKLAEWELRLEDSEVMHVAGTLVSELCVMSAASALSRRGTACAVAISTDAENLRAADEGRADCIIVDDPLFAMERAEEVRGIEVGSDVLLMRDSGPRFLELAFGAQRLGFRQLEEEGRAFEVAERVFEPSLLDSTDMSYFVNKSLVRRGFVRAEGAEEQRWSVHSIVALPCSDHPAVDTFLAEAKRCGIYLKR